MVLIYEFWNYDDMVDDITFERGEKLRNRHSEVDYLIKQSIKLD